MSEDSENTSERHGHCLCGSVKVTAKNASDHVGACHCKSCRRWGGGPFMEIDCGAEVQIDGGDNVSIFNSSDWAERGFCRNCGTHLFYRLKESGQHPGNALTFILNMFEVIISEISHLLPSVLCPSFIIIMRCELITGTEVAGIVSTRRIMHRARLKPWKILPPRCKSF